LYAKASSLSWIAVMMKEVRFRKQITVSILAAAVALLIAGASVVWTFPINGTARQRAKPPRISWGNRGDVKVPVAIYCPEPPCPPQVKKGHCEGAVVLYIVVNAKGRVTKAEMIKPLGNGFDESALKTVRTWRFKPATQDGRRVPVSADVEVNFGTASTALRK
jgi:TonB family protein